MIVQINIEIVFTNDVSEFQTSKKAMKLAQKQAFAKHRSNITNTKFGSKKLNFVNKINKTSIVSKKS